METTIGIIAILLLFVSFVCLILGLIQPKIFSRYYKNSVNRKKTSFIFGSILIICLIPIGFLSAGTPSLAKMKTPTNQKNTVVSGKTSYKNSVIKVYRNGEAVSELKADDKGSFSTSIELKEGKNKIKISATNDKSKTKTSSESIVVLDTTPPNLEIVQPQSPVDTPLITIKGNSEKDATIIIESELKELNRTTVKNNSFELVINNLAEGENKFTIKAIDRADNYSSAKDFTIIYNKPISKEEVKTEPSKEESKLKTAESQNINDEWKAPVKARLDNAINQYKTVYSDMLSALPNTQPPKGDIYQRIQDVNVSGTVDYTWSQFKIKTNTITLMYGFDAIDQDLRKNMPTEKDNVYNDVGLKIDDIGVALVKLEEVCTDWLIGNKTNSEKLNAQSNVDKAISEAEKEVTGFLK